MPAVVTKMNPDGSCISISEDKLTDFVTIPKDVLVDILGFCEQTGQYPDFYYKLYTYM